MHALEHYLAEIFVALIVLAVGQWATFLWKMSSVVSALEDIREDVANLIGPDGSIAKLWDAHRELSVEVAKVKGACPYCANGRQFAVPPPTTPPGGAL